MGLRERKKEQTRQRIAAVALDLFIARGFEAVTINEIAEAAQVAKTTLLTYFPCKEALVLQGVGEDDLGGIVARRPAGQSPLQALRAQFRELSINLADMGGAERDALVARVRLIFGSPALSQAANGLLYEQRQGLSAVLAAEHGQPAAALMAAQIAASLLTLQETFFHHLVEGVAPAEAGRHLAADVELAFDLLEHGLDQAARRQADRRNERA